MLIMYLTLLITWQCYNFDLLLKTVDKETVDKTNYVKEYRKESLMQLNPMRKYKKSLTCY